MSFDETLSFGAEDDEAGEAGRLLAAVSMRADARAYKESALVVCPLIA